jgi:hypothetical protein
MENGGITVTALLWWDDTPDKTLVQKVREAGEWYKQRYGVAPNRCLVNPSALDSKGTVEIDGMSVTAAPFVLPHHFQVWREEEILFSAG